MSLENNIEVSKIATEGTNGAFWKTFVEPYLNNRKFALVENADRIVMNDGSKGKFAVLSGRRKEIQDFLDQVELWKSAKGFRNKNV